MILSAAVLERLRATLPRRVIPAFDPVQLIAAVGALRSASDSVRSTRGYAGETMADIGAKVLGAFANAVAHKKLGDSGLDKDLGIANPSPSDIVNGMLAGFKNPDKPDPGDVDSIFGPRDAYGRKWGDPNYGKAPDGGLTGGSGTPTSGTPDESATTNDEDQEEEQEEEGGDENGTDWAPPGFGGTGTAFNPEGDDQPARGPRLPIRGPGIASYDPEGSGDGSRGGSNRKRRFRRPGIAGMPVPDDDGSGSPLARGAWLDNLVGATVMRQLFFPGRTTLVGTSNVRS